MLIGALQFGCLAELLPAAAGVPSLSLTRVDGAGQPLLTMLLCSQALLVPVQEHSLCVGCGG
jgi:hypothetical protein